MMPDSFVLRPPARRPKHSVLGTGCSVLLLLVFVGGGLFSGLFFYETVQELAGHDLLPWLPPPAVSGQSKPQPGASGPDNIAVGPMAPSAAVQYQLKSRTNILLMGTDQRPEDTSPGRTDTMIVVSVDPATHSVVMLSIPRDLWVPIQGMGFEDRINTAYFYGELKKLPGGGPALAEKTIQYNFGIPINHYILINFVGFRKLVDALGGVTIDVPEAIDDPTFPNDTYGYAPLHIAKGVQHMNGSLALAYARSRHQSSDFSRMRRQQQVLLAIKDQALRLDTLAKIPALWQAHDNLVWTDLKLEDIIGLANLARDFNSEDIHNAVIDESMAENVTMADGAMVLWPDRVKIRQLVTSLFQSP